MARISLFSIESAYFIILITILMTSNLSPAGLTPEQFPGDQIVISVSAIVIDDENGVYSSIRTVKDIEGIYGRANQIWSAAAIKFELSSMTRVTVNDNVLTELMGGNYNPFIKHVSDRNIISSSYQITAIYAHKIGGMNGRSVSSWNLIFITDYPYVQAYRVTSHEIGHILGLSHDVTDPGRLMYSGSDGRNLTPYEISLARQNAIKLLSKTVLKFQNQSSSYNVSSLEGGFDDCCFVFGFLDFLNN